MSWREDREPRWHHDIGYTLQDVVRSHRYNYKNKGAKPDDPGWHACPCGEWEGYWSGFEPHVADHLREAVQQQVVRAIEHERDYPARAWNTTDPEISDYARGLFRGIREGMTAVINVIEQGARHAPRRVTRDT